MGENVLFSYRSRNGENSSDNDSDDSSSESEVSWKRKKVTLQQNQQNQQNPETTETEVKMEGIPEKKKNNIWCAVLSEQSLTENLGLFDVNKPANEDRSRSVESYNFWLKNKDERQERNPRKRSAIIPFKYNSKESDYNIGIRIAERLKEPKHILIVRVIQEIGRRLAVQLLHKTEEIESTGGMLVRDKSRRRTTGGVFFQLLQEHPDVTRTQIDNIFEEERKSSEQHRKKVKALKRRQKLNAAKKKEKPLPTVMDLALTENNKFNKIENNETENPKMECTE